MNETFIRSRLDELRLSKKLSERKLSKQLGKNESYINSISNGKYLPSWTEFFYLCEYFEISPSQFFRDWGDSTVQKEQAKKQIDNLDNETVDLLLMLLKKLQNEK